MSIPVPFKRLLLTSSAALIFLLLSATAASALTYNRTVVPDTTYESIASTGVQLYGPGNTYIRSAPDLVTPVRLDGESYTELSVDITGYVFFPEANTPENDYSYAYAMPFYVGSRVSTGSDGGVYYRVVGDDVVFQWDLNAGSSTSATTASFQAVLHTDSNTVDTYYSGALPFTSIYDGILTPNYERGGTPYSELTGNHVIYSTLSLAPIATPTADDTPTFSGVAPTVDGDVSVSVHAGTDTTGPLVQTRTTTPVDEAYSVDATDLPDGVYTARATQGPSSSPTRTFRVDTAAPAPTLDAIPTPSNDPTPPFSGSLGSAEGDDGFVDVDIYAGSDTIGSPITSARGTDDGEGRFSVEGPELEDGTYTVVARQRDDADNAGASVSRTFLIDTAEPTVTVTKPDPVTNDSTPNVSGVASTEVGDSSEVLVSILDEDDDLVVQYDALVGNGGAYSTAVPQTLPDGEYTALVNLRDSANNVGVDELDFRVDTTAPTVLLVAPIDGSSSIDTTPTFTGTTNDANDVTVSLYEGGSADGPLVDTFVAPVVDGGYSVTSSVELGVGQYTAVVRQTDDAGNAGTSNTSTFRVVFVPSDVSVDATVAPSEIRLGDTTTATFDVAASGADAPEARFRASIPANAELVSSAVSSGECMGTETVECELGTVSPDAPVTVSIVLKPREVGTVSITGDATSAAGDPLEANNSDTVTATVTAAPEVQPEPETPVVGSAPGASTGAASNVGQHAFTVSGTLRTNGLQTTYSFEYGLDAGYGQRTAEQTVSSEGTFDVSALLDGLQLGEVYHYRLVATNARGRSVGEDRTVSTLGRLAPTRLVAAATVKRDTRLPYRFSFAGRVDRPTDARDERCSGNVSVQIKRGKTTVSSRTVRVRSDCTWKSGVTFRQPKRLGRDGRLRVLVRYDGGRNLTAKQARVFTVRFK